MKYEEILSFWFEETAPKQWFSGDRHFDGLVRERFGTVLEQATAAELHVWRATPQGRLAEIIVLDQFSRNIHRGTPRAFAQDPMALVLAQEAVAGGALQVLGAVQCGFLLMPYMHSESRAIHVLAQVLFRDHAPAGNYEFELRHKAIVDRFGRYPHRNEVLGRPSTAEETAFLMQPGSRF